MWCSLTVYGWLDDSYTGEERYQSHILDIGFRKGSESLDSSDIVLFDVISIEEGEGFKVVELLCSYTVVFIYRGQEDHRL